MTTQTLDAYATIMDLHLFFDQQTQIEIIQAMLAEERLVIDSEISDADYPMPCEG